MLIVVLSGILYTLVNLHPGGLIFSRSLLLKKVSDMKQELQKCKDNLFVWFIRGFWT